MPTTVDIVDPLQIPEWNARLATHPAATVFHSQEWCRLLTETYGFRPCYGVIARGDGYQAMLPMMSIHSTLTGRRGVSLPFTDHCPALTSEADDGTRLWQRLLEYGIKARWRTIELRGHIRMEPEPLCNQEYLTHDITLCGVAKDQFAKLRPATRRAIRKAESAGVRAECAISEDGLSVFCGLNGITRQRHGLPPQPRRFFRNLHQVMLSKGMGFICTASYKGEAIASALFLAFGTHALFKYGASDHRAQHLRANNLVMWEAISHCIGKGIKTLSLGRTHPDNTGLRRFKAGWGPTETTFPYSAYDVRQRQFMTNGIPLEHWYSKVFSILPQPLSQSIGSALYGHMG